MIMLWIIILSCYSVAANVDNWAGCSEDQKNRCKHADDDPTVLEKGTCEEKSYAEFTHACTIDKYMQGIKFCCCNYEHNTYCCNYNQRGSLFRCDSSKDMIGMSHTVFIVMIIGLSTCLIVVCFIGICCSIKSKRKSLNKSQSHESQAQEEQTTSLEESNPAQRKLLQRQQRVESSDEPDPVNLLPPTPSAPPYEQHYTDDVSHYPPPPPYTE